MVAVDVSISQSVNELTGLQPCNMGHHMGEHGIGRNVERNTQHNVRRALVELARQLAVGHIELEQAMTGG